MDRPLQLIAALITMTASAMAQGVVPFSQTPDTSALILALRPANPATAPAPGPSPGPREVSPSIAAHLASGMPVYNPQVAMAALLPSAADLREVDKPKNHIPRLPIEMMQKYVVHQVRLPVFRSRDLYTTAALTEMSFKEHPGLRVGNFFNLNAPAAYNRIINEQLFADRLDLVDASMAMAVGGDASEGAVMQQDILDASFASQWQEGPVGIK